MSERSRERSRQIKGKPIRVTWQDVHVLFKLDLLDEDYIVERSPYNDPLDEGPPASVLSDPGLLRAWLAVNHPLAVCDGPDCEKCHLRDNCPCGGLTVVANAKNRVLREVVGRMRDADPRCPVTSNAVLAFMTTEGETPLHKVPA